MRPTSKNLVFSIPRCLHTAAGPPRPQRSFHFTTPAHLPRKRNFFTSNILLANGNGNDGEASTSLNNAGDAAFREQQPPPSSTKRKPVTRKAATKNSLRRVAMIAQQPLKRPSPLTSSTRPTSRIDRLEEEADYTHTISAVCVAQSFDMDAVQEILKYHAFEIDPDDTGFESHEVVHARNFNNGDIFVFPSGTIVTWSVPEETVMQLATNQLIRAAELPHVDRLEVEDLDFAPDGSRDTSVMKGEVVVLGTKAQEADGNRQDTTLAKIAFSSGLARSTKLAVLETSLMAYFESTRRIPALLSRGSHLPLSRKFILQKTGELLSLRAQLNHYSELTDSLPDIFWDSRSELKLEGYYEQVGRALDVKSRIVTLNQKMDYAQEIATVMREMSSEKHSTRLEWIIIVLIAVEVLFELRRVYIERQEMKAAKGSR